MLSETLQEGLEAYEIGRKIRTMRLKKKIGLVELGHHTGLSAAMLSKIERGKLFPTLPTLLRIALVFSVGLDYFFSGPREKPALAIIRKEDRLRFADEPGDEVNYHFESLDYPAVERPVNAYYAEFEPVAPERVRMHDHPGIEFVYVLQGVLVMKIGDDEHQLSRGDAIYFDSSVPHGYRRGGPRPAAAVVVTTA
jgi:transcriptional regulator with XRE-family HTH domain